VLLHSGYVSSGGRPVETSLPFTFYQNLEICTSVFCPDGWHSQPCDGDRWEYRNRAGTEQLAVSSWSFKSPATRDEFVKNFARLVEVRRRAEIEAMPGAAISVGPAAVGESRYLLTSMSMSLQKGSNCL
jgi:hypothetical protein